MIQEKDRGKVKLQKQKNKIEEGFSLIELLVVMGLLGIVLALATTNFTTLLKSLKTESKVAETETETIVGLEILRQDIEHAGYGLPWNVITKNPYDGSTEVNNWDRVNNNNGYPEADDNDSACNTNNKISNYDDGKNNNHGSRAPRAIISGNNVCSDGSDYLVIKSTVVRNERESQKWTYLWNNGTSTQINSWPNSSENMNSTTKVIAINPKQNNLDRVLVTYGSSNSFYSEFRDADSNYSPKPSEVFLLFGIGPDNQLRMPFNRADYFLNDSNVPSRCAPGTKVLTKAVISHENGKENGKLSDYSPLLDCVADMQIVYGIDQGNDGSVDCYTNDLNFALPSYDAENIRNRVREVRVYILAHEGQTDRNYRFGSNTIRVGDSSNLSRCDSAGVDQVLGRDFNLSSITDYQNYRWKVYTLVVLPDNLKGR